MLDYVKWQAPRQVKALYCLITPSNIIPMTGNEMVVIQGPVWSKENIWVPKILEVPFTVCMFAVPPCFGVLRIFNRITNQCIYIPDYCLFNYEIHFITFLVKISYYKISVESFVSLKLPIFSFTLLTRVSHIDIW